MSRGTLVTQGTLAELRDVGRARGCGSSTPRPDDVAAAEVLARLGPAVLADVRRPTAGRRRSASRPPERVTRRARASPASACASWSSSGPTSRTLFVSLTGEGFDVDQ